MRSLSRHDVAASVCDVMTRVSRGPYDVTIASSLVIIIAVVVVCPAASRSGNVNL